MKPIPITNSIKQYSRYSRAERRNDTTRSRLQATNISEDTSPLFVALFVNIKLLRI